MFTIRGVFLAMIGLWAASAVRADYYQCTDQSGGTYKVRQNLSAKYDGFISHCELVVEAAAPPPVEHTTMQLSDPSPRSVMIVLPSPAKKRKARIARSFSKPDKVTEKLIHDVADEYQIDPHLLKAIVQVESGFNSKAVSPKGALGLMQVMPNTGKRYGVMQPAILIDDPAENLRAGARYLRDLSRMFENQLDLVLAAYNAGEGSVIRSKYRIPSYPETQSYVVSVKQAYKTYQSARP